MTEVGPGYIDYDLPPALTKTRKGAGGANLRYVETCVVIDQMNRHYGRQWSSHVKEVCIIHQQPGRRSGTFTYTARAIVRVVTKDGTHEDVGYGDACNMMPRMGIEHAEKSAVSDGIKRCARHFGRMFGNCLYDQGYLLYAKRNPHVKTPRLLHGQKPELQVPQVPYAAPQRMMTASPYNAAAPSCCMQYPQVPIPQQSNYPPSRDVDRGEIAVKSCGGGWCETN